MSEWFTSLEPGTAWMIIIALLFVGVIALLFSLNAFAEMRAERESQKQPVEWRHING